MGRDILRVAHIRFVVHFFFVTYMERRGGCISGTNCLILLFFWLCCVAAATALNFYHVENLTKEKN